MQKRSIAISLVLVFFLSLTACSGQKTAAPTKTIKVRAANLYAQDTSFGKALDLFAESVKKKTNGQVEVQNFHGSELGGERDVAEQLQNGGVELMVTGLAGVGAYVQAYHVIELPYLYESMDQLVEVSKQLKPDLIKYGVEKGFRPVGFMYDGPRNTLAKRALKSADDFKGLKFRVPGVPSYVEMAKALGAIPVSVAYNEVYNALQTGTAEAMEGTADTVFQSKFHEQAKFYNLNKHSFQILYLVANNKWFEGLSAEHKKAVEAAAEEAAVLQIKLVTEQNNAAMEKMKAAGVTIVEIKDLTAFRAATKTMNEKLAAEKGEQGKAMLNAVLQATKPK